MLETRAAALIGIICTESPEIKRLRSPFCVNKKDNPNTVRNHFLGNLVLRTSPLDWESQVPLDLPAKATKLQLFKFFLPDIFN
jgi:hypothetical protein